MSSPLAAWEVLVAPGPRARSSMALEDSARLVGSHGWAERKLFELLGSWATDETDEQCRLIWDVAAARHAAQHELWVRCLPVHDLVSADDLLAPSDPQVSSFLAQVTAGGRGQATPSDPPASLCRLALYGRVVVPRLLAGYLHHLQLTSPTADGPVIRVLELGIDDSRRILGAVEMLAQAWIDDTDTSIGLGRLVGAAESPLAGLGPGLVRWPEPRAIARDA